MSGLRVLITGGTGLLGKSLLETAPEAWEVTATYYCHQPPAEWSSRFVSLDVRDEQSIGRVFLAVKPDVVIHTASVGSVDQAEWKPEIVRQVNVGGTQGVGRWCRRLGARLVLISSNAVFDGLHPPYGEDAEVGAINRYGELKIEAEAWVRASRLAHVIIRPILMYGWPCPGGRDNVVTRWISELERGRTIEVAHDVYSMPLWVQNGAEAIWASVRTSDDSIYHLAGKNRISLVEFAREAARVFGCDAQRIIPVDSRHFTTLASRPSDTSFLTDRMERVLGVRPIGIREGLTAMQRLRVQVG